MAEERLAELEEELEGKQEIIDELAAMRAMLSGLDAYIRSGKLVVQVVGPSDHDGREGR